MKSFKELRSMLSEALSKKLSDGEARKIQKKYNLNIDDYQDLKNDYSPAKTPRPKAWLSLAYPVRDGDYYFAFVSDDEKKNTKFNSKLNDVLRNVGRGRIVGGINKATELADEIWAAVSKEVKKYPKDLGWNDTMTREEIWASIGHMIAAPGFKEEIEEVTIDKMRVGRRKKAPKYEGRYTRNDGGAFDGLRIAQYLSDKDGNKRWSRVSYGDSEDYLNQAMTMLKKDPKRAREILAKPTPRSGSL